MPLYRNGLLIGKLNPPHLGHEMMIRYGLTMCDCLTLLISGKENDFVSPEQRANAIKCEFRVNSFYGRLRIIHEVSKIPECEVDNNGVATEDWYWNAWVKRINKLGKFNAVFTNDYYGERLAKELGAVWLPLDPDRRVMDISSTEIKAWPEKEWQSILPYARPYYHRSVAIVGPESTGKTTMTRYLSRNFKNGYVPEYGRTISELRNNELTLNDFYAIANGQQEMSNAVQQRYPHSINDTEFITTKLFANKYLDKDDAKTVALWQNGKRIHDLYILLAPTVEWVDDGLRVLPSIEERWKFFHDLKNELDENELDYHIIDSDNHPDRLLEAEALVREYLYKPL